MSSPTAVNWALVVPAPAAMALPLIVIAPTAMAASAVIVISPVTPTLPTSEMIIPASASASSAMSSSTPVKDALALPPASAAAIASPVMATLPTVRAPRASIVIAPVSVTSPAPRILKCAPSSPSPASASSRTSLPTAVTEAFVKPPPVAKASPFKVMLPTPAVVSALSVRAPVSVTSPLVSLISTSASAFASSAMSWSKPTKMAVAVPAPPAEASAVPVTETLPSLRSASAVTVTSPVTATLPVVPKISRSASASASSAKSSSKPMNDAKASSPVPAVATASPFTEMSPIVSPPSASIVMSPSRVTSPPALKIWSSASASVSKASSELELKATSVALPERPNTLPDTVTLPTSRKASASARTSPVMLTSPPASLKSMRASASAFLAMLLPKPMNEAVPSMPVTVILVTVSLPIVMSALAAAVTSPSTVTSMPVLLILRSALAKASFATSLRTPMNEAAAAVSETLIFCNVTAPTSSAASAATVMSPVTATLPPELISISASASASSSMTSSSKATKLAPPTSLAVTVIFFTEIFPSLMAALAVTDVVPVTVTSPTATINTLASASASPATSLLKAVNEALPARAVTLIFFKVMLPTVSVASASTVTPANVTAPSAKTDRSASAMASPATWPPNTVNEAESELAVTLMFCTLILPTSMLASASTTMFPVTLTSPGAPPLALAALMSTDDGASSGSSSL